MSEYNKEFGKLGEDAAVKFLQNKGYKIVKKNYRCRYGELDIICKNNDLTVVVEVKTRSGKKYGTAAEAVTSTKIERIIRAAKHYIYKNNVETTIRFDVIEVYAAKRNDEIFIKEINHIKDAFWV